MKVHNILLSAQKFYKQALWSNFLLKNARNLFTNNKFKKFAQSKKIPAKFKLERLVPWLDASIAETVNPELKSILEQINAQVKIVFELQKSIVQAFSDTRNFEKNIAKLVADKGPEAVTASNTLSDALNKLLDLEYLKREELGDEWTAKYGEWKEPILPYDYSTLAERIAEACQGIFEEFKVSEAQEPEIELGLELKDKDETGGPALSEEKETEQAFKEIEEREDYPESDEDDEERPQSNVEEFVGEQFEEAGGLPGQAGGQEGRIQQAETSYTLSRDQKEYMKNYRKTYREAVEFAENYLTWSPEKKEQFLTQYSIQEASLLKYYDLSRGRQSAEAKLQRTINKLKTYNRNKAAKLERYREMRQDPEKVKEEQKRLREYLASARATYSLNTIHNLKWEIAALRMQEEYFANDPESRDEYEKVKKLIDEKVNQFEKLKQQQETVQEKRRPADIKAIQMRGETHIQDVADLPAQIAKLKGTYSGVKSGDTKGIIDEEGQAIKNRFLSNVLLERDRGYFAAELASLATAKAYLDRAKAGGDISAINLAEIDFKKAAEALRSRVNDLVKGEMTKLDDYYLSLRKRIDELDQRFERDFTPIKELEKDLRKYLPLFEKTKKDTSEISDDERNTLLNVLPGFISRTEALSNVRYLTPKGSPRKNTVPILQSTLYALTSLYNQL